MGNFPIVSCLRKETPKYGKSIFLSDGRISILRSPAISPTRKSVIISEVCNTCYNKLTTSLVFKYDFNQGITNCQHCRKRIKLMNLVLN